MSKKLIEAEQPKIPNKGYCYGYCTLWGKNQANILPNPLPGEINTLPVTKEIRRHQADVTSPTVTQRVAHLYKDDERDTLVTDTKNKLQNIGDVVIFIYFGPIHTHALAIKKTSEDTYHYFDCNDGVYEFNEDEFNSFTDLIHPIYKQSSYGVTIEYMPADNGFEPDYIDNVIATVWNDASIKTTKFIVYLESLLDSLMKLFDSMDEVQCTHQPTTPRYR